MTPPHDEEAIRKVEADYDRAWTASDLDALLACMRDDALIVNPRGEVARGKAEIRTLLGAFLGGPAAGTIHESRIKRIEWVTPDVAVVDGEAAIFTPGPERTLSLAHRFTDVLVRDRGTWRIAQVRAYSLTTPAGTRNI